MRTTLGYVNKRKQSKLFHLYGIGVPEGTNEIVATNSRDYDAFTTQYSLQIYENAHLVWERVRRLEVAEHRGITHREH
jgi:hypothetical protein